MAQDKNQAEMDCIQPQYISDFHCDASKCWEMCCKGWRIDVDQNTYSQYQAIPDPIVRAKIMKELMLHEQEVTSSQRFAHIKLRENGQCSFLGQDLRCFIQKNLGEAYLSHICNVYPRQIYEVNGVFLQSLDIACSVAAKLILLVPEPLRLERVPMQKKVDRAYLQKIDLNDASQMPFLKNLPDMQGLVLSLMQDQRFSLHMRLAIMGVFLEQVDALDSDDSIACLRLLHGFEAMVKKAEFTELLQLIPCQVDVRVRFGWRCLELLCRHGGDSERFAAYVVSVRAGLGADDEAGRQMNERYQAAASAYCAPLLRRYPYLLENYFFNQMFRQLFPFMFVKSFTMNFLAMAVLCNIIDLFLIGVAAYYKEQFSERHVIEILQCVSRAAFHTDFFAELCTLLEAEQYDVAKMLPILLADDI